MADILAGRYQLGDVVAVEWNPSLAKRFPAADHHGCRQSMWHDGDTWQRFDPVRCHGYHCPTCGAATGGYGHRECVG